MDYSEWTLDALQRRFVEAGTEFTVLANERHALLVEIESRKTRVEATSRVSALSEKEKDALREVLGPKADPKAVEGAVVVVTE